MKNVEFIKILRADEKYFSDKQSELPGIISNEIANELQSRTIAMFNHDNIIDIIIVVDVQYQRILSAIVIDILSVMSTKPLSEKLLDSEVSSTIIGFDTLSKTEKKQRLIEFYKFISIIHQVYKLIDIDMINKFSYIELSFFNDLVFEHAHSLKL